MHIALIDNYDSFTYNLYHIIEQFSDYCKVMRNDELDQEFLSMCDGIVLSPGPGKPEDATRLLPVLESYASKKPILGICLGMQYIAHYYGAKLKNLGIPDHGVSKPTYIIDTENFLFQGVPKTFNSARYHSWVVSEDDLPNTLQITAVDADQRIMSLKHKDWEVCGVQFHPESVLTPEGAIIIKNWLNRCSILQKKHV